MKEETYLEMIKESFKRRLEIHVRKSHDYASTQEILGNFKRVASLLGTLKVDPSCPKGVAIIYIMLKIDRLCNLIFWGKKPKNESIQDTIDDLKNYCDLLEACIKDEP